jgi:glucosamine--fructose-6-phosphate aminotransferase (isomerizing)
MRKDIYVKYSGILHMCGIVAYLGNEYFKEYVMTGLLLLQNRGYDSVGISYINSNQELEIIKYASTNTHNSLEKLNEYVEKNIVEHNYGCVIGHTRWATHGSKTHMNAHPHHDNKKRISLVHNGIIENYQELKNELLKEGYQFYSQTDTEVITVLIGKYLDEGNAIGTSIELSIEKLKGTWALVINHYQYPNKLWITRNGSPLLLGMEDEFIMIASEQIAFSQFIKKYIILDNHDLIEITKEDRRIQYSKNIHRYEVNHKNNVITELVPNDYDHWMMKEIREQPDAMNRAMNNGGRILDDVSVKLGGLDSQKDRLIKINHLIILGCGTSYHAGLWASEIFKSLDCFYTVYCYDGAEFTARDIPKHGKTGILLLSQSGETKDLHRCIQIAKEEEVICIGIVNVNDSLIARESDCGVYLNAGREVAVASTKSFTNQCIVLAMIAVWFSQIHETCSEKRRNIISDMRNISFQMQTIFEKDDIIRDIAKKIRDKSNMFLLGKGKNEAIAKEGALKIKEITYIHA